MNIADGALSALQAIAQALQPDPELHLDQWSEANVTIPKGSAFAGPYRLAHTPYARRVLQCLSPGHPAARVVVRAASQMLKTQVFINAALGWIDAAPANILALEPTDKLAKRLSSRVGKAIEACSAVSGKVAKPRSRDARNTMDCKEFDGGAVYITTAGAAANLAEIPARYVFCDEVDRMEASVNNEGDPVELAEARTTTYEGISKAYHVSSPTLVGASKIDALHDMGTREEYHVPCPHCGHLHALVHDNFQYDYDPDTDTLDAAWMVCPDCGAHIEEHDKVTMLPDAALGGQARWVAQAKGDGETVSFHINAFYAPLGSISWVKLARQHARAEARAKRGDVSGRQVFYNTRLALSFDNAVASTTVDKLSARAEPYQPRVVPAQALVVTASVDTQPNRLEVQIEAWGPGLEHWLVDYLVLMGSPAEPPGQPGSVWQRLDEIRRTPLPHASGAKPIAISAYGIDSGGANTQDVYNYGAARRRAGCIIIKGHSRPNKPIIASRPTNVDINWQGNRQDGGAELWLLGTDVAKDWLHNRLHLTSGPGAMHFHQQLEREWYEGFLAEKRRVRYVKGFAISEWFKPDGARNEPLDLSVYNLAMAHHLGLHKFSAGDWDKLRARLVPEQLTPDLFAAPMLPPVVPHTPQAQPAPQLEQACEPTPAPAQSAPTPAPAADAVHQTTGTPAHTSEPARDPFSPPVRAGRRMRSKGLRA